MYRVQYNLRARGALRLAAAQYALCTFSKGSHPYTTGDILQRVLSGTRGLYHRRLNADDILAVLEQAEFAHTRGLACVLSACCTC